MYIRVTPSGSEYRRRHDGTVVDPSKAAFAAATGGDGNSTVPTFVQSSSAEMLEMINSRMRQPGYALAVLVAAIVTAAGGLLAIFCYLPTDAAASHTDLSVLSCVLAVVALLVLSTGVAAAHTMTKQETAKRSTTLKYVLTPESNRRFAALQQACKDLSKCSRIWLVAQETPVSDWKRNAGASTEIVRAPASLRAESPPFLNTALLIYALSLNGPKFFFFPDQVLVYKDRQYSAIGYDRIGVRASRTRFIEHTSVPSDGQVVDYTWQYVRKDGGPDLRFTSNRRIAIALYGILDLSIRVGESLRLYISAPLAAEQFAQGFLAFTHGPEYAKSSAGSSSYRSQRQSSRQRSKRGSRRQDSHGGSSSRRSGSDSRETGSARTEGQDPYEVLGIQRGATREEITAAYREMAQQYHPDKVAGLGPEIREVAERKMKAINIAYDQLRHVR